MPKKLKSNPKQAPKSELNVLVAAKFKQALIDYGYKEPKLSLLLAQAAHETDGFKFEKALNNHNYGGVKFQKTFKKLAAPSTTFSPPRKEDKKKTTYASFKDMNDFVKKWARVTHLNEKLKNNDSGAPLEATKIDDYAHRLKQNGYYGDPESVYIRGMKKWNAEIQNKLQPGNPALLISNKEHKLINEPVLTVPNFTEEIPQNAASQIPKRAIDHTGIRKPFDPTKKLKKPYKIYADDDALMKHNPLFNLHKWITQGPDMEKVIAKNPLRSRFGDLEKIKKAGVDKPIEKTNKKLIRNIRINEHRQPPVLSPDQIMRNIFMGHYNIKNKWSNPELYDQKLILENGDPDRVTKDKPDVIKAVNRYPNNANNKTFPAIQEIAHPRNNNDKSESQGNIISDTNKTVHINLNTPMIGNFTISTKDTGSGISNLRQQVEEVLIEALNHVVTIQ